MGCQWHASLFFQKQKWCQFRCFTLPLFIQNLMWIIKLYAYYWFMSCMYAYNQYLLSMLFSYQANFKIFSTGDNILPNSFNWSIKRWFIVNYIGDSKLYWRQFQWILLPVIRCYMLFDVVCLIYSNSPSKICPLFLPSHSNYPLQRRGNMFPITIPTPSLCVSL